MIGSRVIFRWTRSVAMSNMKAPTAMAATVASVLVLGGCGKKEAPPKKPPVPVTVATAKRMPVPYTVEANGLVTPIQTANVAAQVDGLVTAVNFKEGQDVQRGQVLFQIDARPYRAAYEQALAALARDRATAENAAKEVERYTQLVKKDYVTQEQADQQVATANAAKAVVQSDEAAVATAKFNLDNTTVRAPIAGRTGAMLVRVGNLVHGASNTPLVVINQVSPTQVRFAVPSTALPLIQRYGARGGLAVTARPGIDPTQAAQDSASGGPPTDPTAQGNDQPQARSIAVHPGAQGTLAFIDNAVDTTTGTVTLKATFPNEHGALWSGEFVSTVLQLYVEQNALVVPSQAVVTGQQGTYLYVVDSTGSAKQRAVQVERQAGTVTVIASGLSEGERVVTDGQSRITPGAKVTMRAASDSSGGGPAARTGRGRRGASANGGGGA